MNTYQASFTAGEVSYERMVARSDLARNFIGLSILENMFSYLQGGVSTRPGMEHVGSTKDNKKSKLIPFTVSNKESYMLEFSDYKIVIWTYWGDKVKNKDGEELILNTPYSKKELDQVKYVQNGRVMILVSPNIEPYSLRSVSFNEWSLSNFGIEKGPFSEINSDNSIKFKVAVPPETRSKIMNINVFGEGIHTVSLPINITGFSMTLSTPGGMPTKNQATSHLYPNAPLFIDGSETNKQAVATIGNKRYVALGHSSLSNVSIDGVTTPNVNGVRYYATECSPSGLENGQKTIYGYPCNEFGKPGKGSYGAGMGGIGFYYGGLGTRGTTWSTSTYGVSKPEDLELLEEVKRMEGKTISVDFGSLDIRYRDDPDVLLGKVGGGYGNVYAQYSVTGGSVGAETIIECNIPFFTHDHIGTTFSVNNRVPDNTVESANHNNGTKAPIALEVYCYDKWNFRSSGYWSGTVTIDQYDESSGKWITIKKITSTKTGSLFNESGTVDDPCKIRVVSTFDVTFAVPNGYQADNDSLGKLSLSSQSSTQKGIGVIISVLGEEIDGKYKTAMIRIVEPFVYNTWSDEWAESAWSKEKGYPSQVAFYENRLVFAGNHRYPNYLWFSKTNDIKRFSPSRIIKDDDYFNHPLPLPRSSVIQSMVSMGDLIVFLDDGEWKFFSSEGPLTPKTATSKVQSYNGSSYVDPITVNNRIMMLSQNSTRVQEYAYNNNSESFLATDISLYSEHMFRKTKIESWAFQKDPESIIWMVKEDGTLVGLTYLKEEEIFGYHRHITKGKIIDVESLKSEDGNDVWFIVDRGSEGNPIYSVEKFKYHMEYENSFKDSYVLDCFSLCLKDVPTSKFPSGSANVSLRGKKCVALIDGNYEDNISVDEYGSFEISVPGKRVVIGLPFKQTIETLPFDLSGGTGQGHMEKHNPKSVVVRFNNSFMPFVEFNGENRAYEFKFGNGRYGNANEPFSGLSEEKQLPNSPGMEKRMKIFMEKPFPMTVTSISVRV